jgi:hypothetical protein
MDYSETLAELRQERGLMLELLAILAPLRRNPEMRRPIDKARGPFLIHSVPTTEQRHGCGQPLASRAS